LIHVGGKWGRQWDLGKNMFDFFPEPGKKQSFVEGRGERKEMSGAALYREKKRGGSG